MPCSKPKRVTTAPAATIRKKAQKGKKAGSNKKELQTVLNNYIDNPAPFTLLVFTYTGKAPDMFPWG